MVRRVRSYSPPPFAAKMAAIPAMVGTSRLLAALNLPIESRATWGGIAAHDWMWMIDFADREFGIRR